MLRLFPRRLIVWCSLCATTLASTSSFAADSAFISKLPRDSEVLLLSGDKIYRTGRFVRSNDTTLTLKTFDSGMDRFQEEHIAFDQITEVQRIQSQGSVLYPIGLSLFMGGVGAFVGYKSGDDGNYGGDVTGVDQRSQSAFILGLAGCAVGFVLGAVIAPDHHTETTVWTRN